MPVHRLNGPAKMAQILAQRRAQLGLFVEQGLKKGGAYIQRESMAIVPVDTGNMRAGCFLRYTGKGVTTEVRVGYVAEYAVYVHEDLDKRHGQEYNVQYAADIAAGIRHPRKPEEQAKFLERVVIEQRQRIAAIVLKEVQGLGFGITGSYATPASSHSIITVLPYWSPMNP